MAFRVSISTMPRSLSLAISTLPVFSISEFFFSRSLVKSVTSRWAFMACWEWDMPRASTIWLFHRGMVFTMLVWIFSTMRVSLFWIMRIWGDIWMEIILVSSRSWIFFSKRVHMLA